MDPLKLELKSIPTWAKSQNPHAKMEPSQIGAEHTSQIKPLFSDKAHCALFCRTCSSHVILICSAKVQATHQGKLLQPTVQAIFWSSEAQQETSATGPTKIPLNMHLRELCTSSSRSEDHPVLRHRLEKQKVRKTNQIFLRNLWEFHALKRESMQSQPIPGAENLPQHGVRALSRNGKYLFHALVLEASTAKVFTAII